MGLDKREKISIFTRYYEYDLSYYRLMKKFSRIFVVTASALLVSLASCTSEKLLDGRGESVNPAEVATIAEQSVSLGASMSEIRDLQESIDVLISDLRSNDSDACRKRLVINMTSYSADLEEIADGVEEYVESLNSVTSWVDGTLSTLALQKQLASFAGALEGELSSGMYDEYPTVSISALDENVSLWVGDAFDKLYFVSKESAKVEVLASGLLGKIETGKSELGRLASAEGAGDLSDQLRALGDELDMGLSETNGLQASLSALEDELEMQYVKSIECSLSDPGKYNAEELASANRTAAASLKSVDNSISGLIARVAECEEAIAAILERLGELESEVDAVLDMIQSVTFVSEYDHGAAIAYYEMTADVNGDGMMERKPAGTMDMSFIVRPSSAASSLANSSVWNKGLTVKGYYAQKYQLYASDFDFVDFTISKVTADASTGLVKVSVNNSFSNDFYFKNTGLRTALSIKTGKTDITSDFVSVEPKDKSGKIYVTALKLSASSVHVVAGESVQLSATVTPDNATLKTCTWKSWDTDIVTVDNSGKLFGKKAGEAMVECSTDGTDEYGRKLSAQCKVYVDEAIKLTGPTYVEVNGTAQMFLDYPSSATIGTMKWSTSNSSRAVVNSTGLVTGVSFKYNQDTKDYDSVDIICTVNCDGNDVTVSFPIKVVAVQPSQIKIATLADNVNKVTIKMDKTFDLSATVYPENVDMTQFHLGYRGSNNGVATVDYYSGMLTAVGPGSMYVDIDVQDEGHYFAPGRSLRRTVHFDIEPYWVKNIVLPYTSQIEVGSTTIFNPTFTSDVDGVQPNYTNVEWTSSNPSVATVNKTTGEVAAKSVGTTYIRATTTDSWAVKGGGTIYAECQVTVINPAVALNIGDYFYSDGTWSTEMDAKKTVIGVVFAKVDATASDSQLAKDFPDCRHGLVVSTAEYTSKFVADREWSYVDLGVWMKNNGYDQFFDQDKPSGYSNTKGFIAANNASISSYGDIIDFTLFNENSPVVTHRNSVAAPSTTSGWYIPSFKEMQLLYDAKTAVNNTLGSVSGTKVAATSEYMYQYWCSSVDLENKVVKAVTMNNGQWMSSIKTETSVLPVRVVLAF